MHEHFCNECDDAYLCTEDLCKIKADEFMGTCPVCTPDESGEEKCPY